MDAQNERRNQRSAELQTALSRWLNSVAQRSGAELVVLSNEEGQPLAANPAGTDPERLKARVPASETAVLPVEVFRHENRPLYLWARGSRGSARLAVSEAEKGLQRILAENF